MPVCEKFQAYMQCMSVLEMGFFGHFYNRALTTPNKKVHEYLFF